MMRNPVLMREIKTMFRSPKPFFAVTAYAGGMFFILYQILKHSRFNRFNGFNPQIAAIMYITLISFQMILTYFIVPALAGSSISSEREKQTLDLMLMTRMTSKTIVRGKLMSSLLLFCIIIIASMPVYAVTFYYSAANIIGFAAFMLYCFANAMCIGSAAVFFSAFFKKTAAATTVSYLFIFSVTAASTIILVVLSGLEYAYFTGRKIIGIPFPLFIFILALNPVTSFFSMIDFQIGAGIIDKIIKNFTNGSATMNIVWIINIIINLIASSFFIKLAAMTIEPVFYKKISKKQKIEMQKKADNDSSDEQ